MPDHLQDCPANDHCPPVCASVFDRVVVSHIITRSTRVMWELLPTFTDPRPLEFQLQVGSTVNPNADDWTDVGLPVVDQYIAFDDEQRVWGKTNWTHYRVKLITPLGTYYSDPTGGLGVLDRRSWRIARELARSALKGMAVGTAGQRGYLLKRRWTGTPCPICLDHMTREVRNPYCPDCYGTGFACGYYYPMSCIWAELSPRSRRTHLDGGQGRGTVDDIVVPSRMVMTELMGEDDVWVADKTDDRYFIHEIQHTEEIRGVPVIATVSLRLIPYSHVLYTIEIPQQLKRLGVT